VSCKVLLVVKETVAKIDITMAEILVVEDDADLVETYKDLLEAQAHSVISSSGLSQARNHLLKICPEILILDLNLPGCSGSDIAHFVRHVRSLNSTKIIIISGHPEMALNVDWMDDIDLIFSKPVDNQHLIMMIERLCSHKKA
jgi:two-component system, NtrC family, phosphoglycerate transport system response regulator PgtA